MKTFDYAGVMPILPTPFFDDERVDIDSLLRLVAFSAASGANGVTILGVLGEAHLLTDAEAEAIVREVCSGGFGIPVVVGASRPGVYSSRSFVERAAVNGADAVMLAPPTVEGISESAIFEFYRLLAIQSPLPIVAQDHPNSTKVPMSVDLLVRIVEELDAVTGLKMEAVPTATKLRAVRDRLPEVRMLTGLGALYGATDLAAGSDGFNTGFAFPEFLVELHRLAAAGELVRARQLYRHFLPLIVFEQHPGPAIRKEVWRQRGLLSTSRLRAPGAQLNPWMAEELATILRDTVGGTDLRTRVTDFGALSR